MRLQQQRRFKSTVCEAFSARKASGKKSEQHESALYIAFRAEMVLSLIVELGCKLKKNIAF